MATKRKKICTEGHAYYKTSDCDTCPVCEKEKSKQSGWMQILSAPARRALEKEGIESLAQLAKYSSKELLNLHGMGPASIPKITAVLKQVGLILKS